MGKAVRTEAGQGAEVERVTWAVPGLIRLWKSVENSKAEPFTKTVKDAAPRQRSVCYPPTTHCWSSNKNIATKPGDAEECPQENSR